MGLFSLLFGDKAKIIDDIADAKKQEALERRRREQEEYCSDSSYNEDSYTEAESGTSGLSWGPVMPAEENQFNYSGTYKEYFNDVFRNEFPEYSIESADQNNGRTTVFTFWDGSRKALVVELLSEKSSVYKLRKDCRDARVPYLRYYYDHHGWWNTREYVIQRTRSALMG